MDFSALWKCLNLIGGVIVSLSTSSGWIRIRKICPSSATCLRVYFSTLYTTISHSKLKNTFV